MYARPAGMSDDEDDDGFSFPDEDSKVHDRYEKTDYIIKKTEPVMDCKNPYPWDTEKFFECNIVNACKMGYVDIVKKYLENHNVDDFLDNGWTPLLHASLYEQLDVIDCLLKHGGNPNKHKDAFTPLMALCSSTEVSTDNSINCLKLLLNAKANANLYNKNRETALMLACKSKSTDFISELLPHVTCINACDSDGRNALIYAVGANKPDVVKLLLESDANPMIPDRFNRTAKDVAVQKDFKEIIRLFKDDAEGVQTECEISSLDNWKDMFPELSTKNGDVVNCDIASILRGMGLEAYMHLFKGMDLNIFLQLTEQDLSNLGIDISCHRKQFMDCLHMFHSKRWNIQSLGATNKSEPYTMYNGVLTLGTVAKQIRIIESSFRYIKNSLGKADEEGIHLTPEEKLDYEEQFRKTQRTLSILKEELLQIKMLAKKMDKESDIGASPSYIGPKYYKANGTVILSITIMIGIFLSKNAYISWLWNK